MADIKSIYKVEEIQAEKGEIRHFHSHRHYVLLFVLAGSCHYNGVRKEADQDECGHIGGTCILEDLLCIRPGEKLELRMTGGGKQTFCGLVFKFGTELLTMISDEETNLAEGFEALERSVLSVHVNSSSAMLIRNLNRRLLQLVREQRQEQGQEQYQREGDSEKGIRAGSSIYERGIISILIVILYRALLEGKRAESGKRRKGFDLDDLFVYIREHLTEELTLDDLERHFYVSKYHIAREFKRQANDTVHHYIVKARLDLCRDYIASGMSVKQAYEAGGFGGYNHFFRAFKQEYGMTPKEYWKKFQQDS